MSIILFKKSKNRGFTLIELIIVTAIVALISIATLAVLNPFGQFNKARDARIKSDLSQVQKALESYYQDNGKYPSVSSNCSYDISGNNGDGNDCIEWGKSWQPYMNVVPKDPSSGHTYVYYATADRQSYFIYASLNRATDPQACNGGAACSSLANYAISSVACGGTCNFGVSTPDKKP
ncbi:MAG TPA: type II secretion system protein GspG [Candidatus Sulfotelmatobacter sp.]|nr:type II secretion system protein GspG [Candidatus Sulfotelmatobacter sp.]